ncbi:glycosyltransferase [Kocuria rhizophila]|uniref:glycosyltransferase n=1 Tax=Kocuria TaxID=57493 RepID=UPI0002F2D3E4|nr:glycosyltransferase [Kocuria rhizophila]MDN3227287.1 glycosyltransferase [Kocuria rhizophila]WIW67832.1 glycosyltransferase [Kocuria sp. ChxB]
MSAPLHVTVVLAADACTDRTVERASAAWAASGLPEGTARLEVVTGSWRSAGGARAAAASWALANCRPEWIASTDADTAVPGNWVAHQLERAAHGVDAVLGTVEPDPAECPVAVYRLWQREHTLAEGHPHIHAANMGVRARSYERAGGFPALECSEDEALVAALHRVGARIEATDRIRVITSARFEGRAELGFAHHLLGLAQLAGQPEEAPWPGAGQPQRPEPAGRANGPEFFAHRKNA